MTLQKIPYGVSNYRTIIEKNYAYIDKTRFIRLIETTPEPYLIFLRPRRFGKSLFVSLLTHYYDISLKEEFFHLFGPTDIGRNPTPEKNCYYMLNFNFSGITTDSHEQLADSFSKNVRNSLNAFISKYTPHLPLLKLDTAPELLSYFLQTIGPHFRTSYHFLINPFFVIVS